jgi:glycerophosphoryl diester phosphodiesterase
MWNEFKNPIIIAHRGDSAHAPENTLAAFQMAHRKGADAIEFDVKLSSDGIVLVIHDQTVDRTTDGHGDVRHMSMAALRELDAGVRFEGKFPGERIPTLEEVFETIGNQLHMNVELTNYATPGDALVMKVIELVRKHNLQKKVLFSSFFLRNLRMAQAILPEVPCGLLAQRGLLGYPARTWGWRRGLYALNPHFSSVKGGMVSRLHASGKRIHVWPVNAKSDMEYLLSMGVDGIITDDPALLGACLGRKT